MTNIPFMLMLSSRIVVEKVNERKSVAFGLKKNRQTENIIMYM